MRFAHIVLPLSLVASVFSAQLFAQDDPRLERMQQTIQELTLQLGDAIRENAALRQQLASRQDSPAPEMKACEPSMQHVPVAPHQVTVSPSQPVPRATPSIPIQPTVSVPVMQCEIATLEQRLAQFSDPTTRESTLNTWLEDHGSHCTRAQLQQLRDVASQVTLSDDASALIDYYMSTAR